MPPQRRPAAWKTSASPILAQSSQAKAGDGAREPTWSIPSKIDLNLHTGSRPPAYATSIGKLLP
ncbi:MAG: hypothetical protein ACRDJX_03400, partial [Solirubrobacteraceae bacterium]